MTASAKTTSQDPNVKIENGVQVVRMTQVSSGYLPNKFTIKKGIPVRWIVTSKDVYSCASSIVSQQLGIRKGLELGENIFEFTPKETGTIRFSCIMGMYTGSFNVVDESSTTSFTPLQEKAPIAQNQATSGAGASCGQWRWWLRWWSEKQVTATAGETTRRVQLLKATYTSR